jgi:uncharacterized protein YciI
MRALSFLFLLTGSLGAAELQSYCWGFLNAHPERGELSKERAEEIQKGHLAHMGRMAEEGHLLAAGPLATPGGARGLLVYKCESVAQAEQWTQGDPAVVNKRLAIEMYRWMSSGVFGEPLASKLKQDPKYKYTMVKLPFAVLMRTATPPSPDVRKRHFEHAMRLVAQGKLRAFGPFESSPDKLGVFIYGAIDIEEARQLAQSDPLVAGGFATAAMHIWFVADEAVPR